MSDDQAALRMKMPVQRQCWHLTQQSLLNKIVVLDASLIPSAHQHVPLQDR